MAQQDNNEHPIGLSHSLGSQISIVRNLVSGVNWTLMCYIFKLLVRVFHDQVVFVAVAETAKVRMPSRSPWRLGWSPWVHPPA